MRKTKILALLLVVAIVASMVVPSVSAEDTYEAYMTEELTGADSATVEAGQKFAVYVSIAGNPGISAITMRLQYPEGWSVSYFEDCKLFDAKATTLPTFTNANPYYLQWVMPYGTTPGRNDPGKKLSFENGDLCLVEFEVPADAVSGEYELSLNTEGLGGDNYKEATDANGVIIEGGTAIGNVCPDTSKKFVVTVQGTEPEVPAGAACPEHTDVTTWTEIAEGTWTGGAIEAGHYKLTGNQSTTTELTIAEGAEVCIDLNGYTIANTATGNSTSAARVFNNSGKLTITDLSEEKLGQISKGKKYGGDGADLFGGNIYNAGTLNLYAGTITGGIVKGGSYNSRTKGGNIYNIGTFNMYGGAVVGGKIEKSSYTRDMTGYYSDGANIYSTGTVNVQGGVISGGSFTQNYTSDSGTNTRKSVARGGNICCDGGTLTINNATVTGGTLDCGVKRNTSYIEAKAYGGNIYTADTTVVITNSTVTNGSVNGKIASTNTEKESFAGAYGGNIYINGGSFTMTGSTVSGGNSSVSEECANTTADAVEIYGYGGNMYLYSTVVNVENCVITDSSAYYRGGNIYLTSCSAVDFTDTTISDGELTISSGRGGNVFSAASNVNFNNCTISGGVGKGRGGNLAISGSDVTVAINGGTMTAGENASDYGGNIYATDGDSNCLLVIGGGAVISGGKAKYGGNIAAMYGNVTINDATIKDGTSTSAGGNIYITGTSKASTAVINAGAVVENGSIYVTATDKDTAINTLTVKTGAAVGHLSSSATRSEIVVENGVVLTSDPTAYMVGEATVLVDDKYTTYATLTDALAAAAAGAKITLAKDATVGNAMVKSGVTVDLNGKTLTATGGYTAAMVGTQTIDSVGGGKLITPSAAFTADNAQLPVGVNGEYVFENVEFATKYVDDGTKATYKFYIKNAADATKIDDAIKAGETVGLEVKVNWTVNGEAKYKVFTLDPTLVGEFAENWDTKAIVLTINDITGISDVVCTAQVTVNGVTVTA